MPILGGANAVGEMWNILRQVNLAEIRDQAERRFTLLVTGDLVEAERLAMALSRRPGGVGVHPWLQVAALPVDHLGTWLKPEAAILVLTAPEPGPAEQEALDDMARLGIPAVAVVAGPAATLPGAGVARLGEAARIALADVTDTQALGAALLPALANAVAHAFPDAEVSLARQLPVLRDTAIARMIEETSRTNAMFSATTGVGEMIPILTLPLVLGDTVVLTKNQLLMAYKIALAAGKEGQPQDVMGEIVGVIGGALLFRTVARELMGLIPVIGIVPKVAVAYTGTKVIGRAVEIWAVEERRPSADEIRHLAAQNWSRGRAMAADTVDKARQARQKRKKKKRAPQALPPPAAESAPVDQPEI